MARWISRSNRMPASRSFVRQEHAFAARSKVRQVQDRRSRNTTGRPLDFFEDTIVISQLRTLDARKRTARTWIHL